MNTELEIIINFLFPNYNDLYKYLDYNEINYMYSCVTHNNIYIILLKLSEILDNVHFLKLELEIEIEEINDTYLYKILKGKKKIIKNIKKTLKNNNISYIIVPLTLIEKSIEENYHANMIVFNVDDKTIYRY